MNCTLQGSFVHEISQARVLEWVAISSSRGFFDVGIVPVSLYWQADFFFFLNHWATWEAHMVVKTPY